MSVISRTIFPACKAKPAHEPTSPPPPMMLTFIIRRSLQIRMVRGQGAVVSRQLSVGSCQYAFSGIVTTDDGQLTTDQSEIQIPKSPATCYLLIQCGHHLLGDHLHERFDVG